MGAVIDRFLSSGVRVDIDCAGQLRAFGHLTDDLRRDLRQHKPAILTELEELAELRELVAWLRIAEPDRWTDADQAEANAVGCRDIGAALVSLRALKAEKRDYRWTGFALDNAPEQA
jgi:hypothetical protein